MNPIAFGTPYKEEFSTRNLHIVRQAVAQRFPQWAAECKPGVNVLTIRAWNQRGYRVKKGEKAIRLNTQIPVKEKDKNGAEKVVGSRFARAFVFAQPQVEKRQ